MEGDGAWIESNGGPLLLLPESALRGWRGVDGPASGKTDYERACAVLDVGFIPVGARQGLVLADEPLPTRVYRAAPNLSLIRWRFAPNDRAVDELLARPLPSLAWEPVGVLAANGEELVLFDSAFPGDDIVGASTRVSLSPGEYVIETAEFSPSSEIALQLVRFRALAA